MGRGIDKRTDRTEMNKDKPCSECGAVDSCHDEIGDGWEHCWFPVGEILIWKEVILV
jgi:hypothetical protein